MVLSEAGMGLLMLLPPIIILIAFPEFLITLASLSVIVVDMIILVLMLYYLSLISLAVTFFARYYHTQLVVTNKRIYETSLNGIFSILPHELSLPEVLEISYRARGLFGMLFNVGDISIHSQGLEEDYLIQSVLKADLITAITSSLIRQVHSEVPQNSIEPDLKIIAIIEDRTYSKGSQFPPILNFSQSIKTAQQKVEKKALPNSFKNSFNLWWWTQLKKEHTLYIDSDPKEISNLAKSKGEDARKKNP